MSDDVFRVFVYGTLKSGYWNHEPYCSGALDIQPAHVRGRLYIRHSGTPILAIDRADIVSPASQSYQDDVSPSANDSQASPSGEVSIGEEFALVSGELITFRSDPQRLVRLDELEEFSPQQEKENLYERVLVRPSLHPDVLSWVYIIPHDRDTLFYNESKNPENWDPLVELTKDQIAYRQSVHQL